MNPSTLGRLRKANLSPAWVNQQHFISKRKSKKEELGSTKELGSVPHSTRKLIFLLK